MIVSIVECDDHGKLGIMRFYPPSVKRNGEAVYSGPYHISFECGTEVAGYGEPDLFCTEEEECVAPLHWYCMNDE